MKALIVDDERHVREAVILLVDWQKHGILEVFEATDGHTAIQAIEQHKPQIIFTDMMMPGMDGSELLSWIQEHAPWSKTIVISGHDDFQLVRHTMTAGGLDYILKPIDAEQLQEAVKQAVHLWKQENNTRNQQYRRSIEVNLMKPIYWDKLFTELIQHPGTDTKKLAEIKREFPDFDSMQVCRCSVLSLAWMDDSIKAKYEQHRDLLFFTLTNVCNEFLRKTLSGFAFRYWASEEEIVLIQWKEPASMEPRVEEINHALMETLGSRFDFGIGTVREFPAQVQQAYKEAKAALQQRNLKASGDRIYVLGAAGDSRSFKERNIMAEIQKYIQLNYNTDLSLMRIASKFFLSREYISRRFKQDFGVNVSDYVEQIRMEKAKLYLLNPNMKMARVAEMIGYQDEKYFSKVFKKTTGATPQEYRNKQKGGK